MADILNQALGKVFTHPVTGASYGPIGLPDAPTNFATLDGTSFPVLAEDPCGNCFTMREDGSVWFWDHETDDLVLLANSVAELVLHCTDPPPVELSPGQVKSVWIDPAFAKSIGMKVSNDGWVKKPSKPK